MKRYNESSNLVSGSKRPVYKSVELREISPEYWTCSFRVGARAL